LYPHPLDLHSFPTRRSSDLIFLLTKPVGIFMTRVFNREKTFLDPFLRPIERVVYRLTGVDEKHEMRWTEYAIAMLLFSGVSMALLYLIERTQKRSEERRVG